MNARRDSRRLAISYSVLALFLMLLVTMVASLAFMRLQAEEEDKLAGTITAILGDTVSRVSFSGKYQARLLVEQLRAHVPDLAYVSVERDAQVIASSDPTQNDKPVPPELWALGVKSLATGAPALAERRVGGTIYKEIAAPFRGGFDNAVIGVVRAGIEVSAARKRQLMNLLGLLLLVAMLSVFAFAVVFTLSRRFGDLSRSNEELESALRELTETQSRLVQSEKLAALGQLVAGLAHEINTPLGAIASSNENILASLKLDLPRFIELARSLDEEEAKVFLALLEESGEYMTFLSPESDWEAKKALTAELESRGESSDRETVEMILNLGLYRPGASLASILPFRRRREALIALHSAAMMRQSSEIIKDAGGKAGNIVQALKYYSYPDERDQASELELKKDLESLLAIYRNKIKHGVEVTMDFSDEGRVVGHRGRLNQVWMNLINNALQAMDNKGRLALAVRRVGDRVLVSVEDNGPGIAPEARKRIFEPFFTTKALGEGTGLGLAICKKIVETHGGEIAYSTSPEGTVFTVSLPAAGAGALSVLTE